MSLVEVFSGPSFVTQAQRGFWEQGFMNPGLSNLPTLDLNSWIEIPEEVRQFLGMSETNPFQTGGGENVLQISAPPQELVGNSSNAPSFGPILGRENVEILPRLETQNEKFSQVLYSNLPALPQALRPHLELEPPDSDFENPHERGGVRTIFHTRNPENGPP